MENDRKQRRARKQKADSKQEEKDGITAGGGIIKAGSKKSKKGVKGKDDCIRKAFCAILAEDIF